MNHGYACTSIHIPWPPHATCMHSCVRYPKWFHVQENFKAAKDDRSILHSSTAASSSSIDALGYMTQASPPVRGAAYQRLPLVCGGCIRGIRVTIWVTLMLMPGVGRGVGDGGRFSAIPQQMDAGICRP